jgi:hypothetical protein
LLVCFVKASTHTILPQHIAAPASGIFVDLWQPHCSSVAFIRIVRQVFSYARNMENHIFCRQIISHASSNISKTLDRVIWLSEHVMSVAW